MSPVLPKTTEGVSRVALVKTRNRTAGVRRALQLLQPEPMNGQRILLKPNCNSADPAPGSTHEDVLRAVVGALWDLGAKAITVGDRSGMGNTRTVMREKRIFALGDELGFDTLAFDELEAEGWAHFQHDDTHWKQGFVLARPCIEADAVVQTCCLKTHGFGGHFTMSLKNSVGMVAKRVPGTAYDYMHELHSSPYQREMIAEINAAYSPALVVMDGVDALVDGGPATGLLKQTNVILASADRVAIDAVGVAMLRLLGTNETVARGLIFQQAQIRRAVELGIGATGSEKIELLTGDSDSQAYASLIRTVLDRG